MEFRVDSRQGHKLFVSPLTGHVTGAPEVEITVRGFVLGDADGTLTISGPGFDPAEE